MTQKAKKKSKGPASFFKKRTVFLLKNHSDRGPPGEYTAGKIFEFCPFFHWLLTLFSEFFWPKIDFFEFERTQRPSMTLMITDMT